MDPGGCGSGANAENEDPCLHMGVVDPFGSYEVSSA